VRWSTAAGVGVVVVVAAAIMVAAYVLLASAGIIGNTYVRTVDFPDAQGVTKGTDVQMAGVKIGQVDAVGLSRDNRALLTLRILQRYPILERYPLAPGTEIHIAATGLLTTPIVEIVPPKRPETEKGVLHGTSPPTIDQLMPQAQQLLTNLNGLTHSLQGVLGDRQLIANLKRSTQNLAEVSERGKVIGANLAEVSERGKAIATNLQSASVSGRQIAAGFKQTTRRLDRTAALLQQTVGENREKLGETITSVNDTMQAMKGLVEHVNDVVVDPKLKDSLQGTVVNLNQATANLVKISDSLEKLSADQQLNEDLRATVANTRATTAEAAQLLGRLNHLLGGGHRSAATTREKVENTAVTVDVAEQTRPGRPRLDLNAYIPAGSARFYRIGLGDVTETNKLNLQFGEPFLGNSARFGLYGSRLGVGLDVGAPSHPHFSADLYSLADPRLDLRARAGIGPGLDLTVGVLSAFRRNTPTVGVTWRR
jgi:phospholipid/cholesterol/gamma-HCH transport system substrate-binding protein